MQVTSSKSRIAERITGFKEDRITGEPDAKKKGGPVASSDEREEI